MAWDTTDIPGDIISQDGTFAYLFKASGAVYKGQIVEINADNSVMTSVASSEGIGVADHNAANQVQVAIYGPGNIVNLCMDVAGAVGGPIYADAYGLGDATAASTERIMGYQVTLAAAVTTNYVCKALLV